MAYAKANSVIEILGISSNANATQPVFFRMVRRTVPVDGVSLLHVGHQSLQAGQDLVGPRREKICLAAMQGTQQQRTIHAAAIAAVVQRGNQMAALLVPKRSFDKILELQLVRLVPRRGGWVVEGDGQVAALHQSPALDDGRIKVQIADLLP